jgi:hypothetical protein
MNMTHDGREIREWGSARASRAAVDASSTAPRRASARGSERPEIPSPFAAPQRSFRFPAFPLSAFSH